MIHAIQDLLKTSGRAIVPGIGCLSVNDESEIVFNPYLTFNDGKLINWFIHNEALDESAANQKVAAWVKEIRDQISKGQAFSLGALGKFIPEGKGEIGFTADVTLEKNDSSDRMSIAGEKEFILANTTDSESEERSIAQKNVNEAQDLAEILQNQKEIQNELEREDEKEKENEITERSTNQNSGLWGSDDIYRRTEEGQIQGKLENDTQIHDQSEDTAIESAIHQTNGEAPGTSTQSSEIIESEALTQIESTSEKTIQQKKSGSDTNERKKKDKKLAPKSEEVIIKRKRSSFFYVNLVLSILIVIGGAVALIYPDELSKILGITPLTEQITDSIPVNSIKESGLGDEMNDIKVDAEKDSPLANESPELNIPSVNMSQNSVADPIANSIPAVASGGNFHIIVGKFVVKENADRLVQKIRDSGYDGKILRSTSTGHTVSFHSYPTLEDAKNNLNKAKEICGTGAYVEKIK
jgi:hypothetical protein